MNVFIGSGKVTKISLLNGEMNMLKFTLIIKEKGEKQERIDYVPCIIYNPTEQPRACYLKAGK